MGSLCDKHVQEQSKFVLNTELIPLPGAAAESPTTALRREMQADPLSANTAEMGIDSYD